MPECTKRSGTSQCMQGTSPRWTTDPYHDLDPRDGNDGVLESHWRRRCHASVRARRGNSLNPETSLVALRLHSRNGERARKAALERRTHDAHSDAVDRDDESQ